MSAHLLTKKRGQMYTIKIKIDHIVYKYTKVKKLDIKNNKIYITTDKRYYLDIADIEWFKVEKG